jgi:hypothetical protein
MTMPVRIALDFDDTYTADPGLWDVFVKAAQARGHLVAFVTWRDPNGDNDDIVEVARTLNLPIIFTCFHAKREFAKQRGYVFDIWIDDKPEAIFTDYDRRRK